jgi:hypothetical protein
MLVGLIGSGNFQRSVDVERIVRVNSAVTDQDPVHLLATFTDYVRARGRRTSSQCRLL